ncbi:MAG: leucyl aminopeptidase family protein [Hyphomicrobiaceae bacterium]
MDAAQRARDTLLDSGSRKKTIPITLVSKVSRKTDLAELAKSERSWIAASGFRFAAGTFLLLPDAEGGVGRVVCGTGKPGGDMVEEGVSPSACFALGALAGRLPDGDYHLETDVPDAGLAAVAWALGAYRFGTYKSDRKERVCRLKVGKGVDAEAVGDIAASTYLGRDLINLPANDLGPDELEAAARSLAAQYKARVAVTTGKDLLKHNFPMIHAVGRASDRAPRLIDMRWGAKSHPKVTLVGKGIVFDTGGLNLKPGNAMTLMKKDMGGAATALALASMVMAAKLPVQLRVLLPVAENSVSANAYRPGDVLTSRNGMTVEIGNTDAEGRLVLADALSLADDESPDDLFCFATLTGAARVALGPDLPPFYVTDDRLAEEVLAAGLAVNDPLWRMPFWGPYDQMLKSSVADVSHISNGPFAGSVTAAMFLKRFVHKSRNFAHIDLYGWVPSAKPGFPKGGEPQGARAVFEALQRRYG